MFLKREIIENISNKIIKQVKAENAKQSQNSRNEVFNNIIEKIAQSEKLSKNRFRQRLAMCSAAAVVACAMVYSIYINNSAVVLESKINYEEISKSLETKSKEVIISLNNSQVIEVGNNANIEHTTSGDIKVDEQIVNNSQTDNTKSQISQIIVPKSKRAEVMLSDGTKVTLNSDSRMIYATNFNSSIREVYIEGEAFLDVAKDNGKPFIVKTKKFTVNVTGTKFNVTSYNDDQIARVVLVEGKVNIDIADRQKMYLDPGQMMQNDNTGSKIENVDIYKYTSWLDKIMIFESQSLKEVADRVSRFYDVDLVIDPAYSNIVINGKLDLKDNVEDVIKTISLISDLKITHLSNSTILTK